MKKLLYLTPEAEEIRLCPESGLLTASNGEDLEPVDLSQDPTFWGVGSLTF